MAALGFLAATSRYGYRAAEGSRLRIWAPAWDDGLGVPSDVANLLVRPFADVYLSIQWGRGPISRMREWILEEGFLPFPSVTQSSLGKSRREGDIRTDMICHKMRSYPDT